MWSVSNNKRGTNQRQRPTTTIIVPVAVLLPLPHSTFAFVENTDDIDSEKSSPERLSFLRRPQASMASSLLKAIFFIPLMILILERLLGTANYQRDLFGTIVATELATIEAPSIEQQQQPIKIRGASLEPPTNQTAIIVGEKDNTKSGGGDEEVVARPSNNKNRAAATRIPLNVLVGSDDDVKVGCSDGLMRAPQRHLPYEELFSGGRRIPRIVHQTSKSQCLTKKFFHTVKQWLLLGDDWAYYLHTDEAIDTLFAQDWPEFPHLGLVLQCLEGKGTLKADLWRYLALYQYGGIYVDVDTKPAKFNASTITAQDDGFFTVEQYHLLSQYFMATSPRHRKYNNCTHFCLVADTILLAQ